jgi:hypothetical protein
MKKSFSFGVLGSGCLFFGLLLTLLKYAHSLWLIVTAAILGCALIARWRKSGLILSLFLLACALCKTLITQAFFWPILLSCCIGISWLIFYLEHEQSALFLQEKEDLIATLQSDVERLKAISFRDALERAQLESELRMQKVAYENNLKNRDFGKEELQQSKTDSSGCFGLKPVEKDPDELKSLQALQAQHAQLREQFEQKSEILHQTRKELFALESAYLTLKNEIGERICAPVEEHFVLAQCLEQMQEKEEQILVLEEIISLIVVEKKPSAPRKRKTKKELDLFLMAPRQTIYGESS